MQIMTPYQYISMVGIGTERMPAPGSKPVYVAGDPIAASRAAHALRQLGFEVIDHYEPDCFIFNAKPTTTDVCFVEDWMRKYTAPELDRLVKQFALHGVNPVAARMYIVDYLVKRNQMEVQ